MNTVVLAGSPESLAAGVTRAAGARHTEQRTFPRSDDSDEPASHGSHQLCASSATVNTGAGYPAGHRHAITATIQSPGVFAHSTDSDAVPGSGDPEVGVVNTCDPEPTTVAPIGAGGTGPGSGGPVSGSSPGSRPGRSGSATGYLTGC